jgi:hypothetical protein
MNAPDPGAQPPPPQPPSNGLSISRVTLATKIAIE